MSMIIGITGGIASGKSTVVHYLRQEGYQVIDADQVVHELQAKGGRLYKALVTEFGQTILQENGELDRPKLSKLIFSDPKKKERSALIQNQIIRQSLKVQKDQLAKTNAIVFMDIPLLIELNYLDWFDQVWLVYVNSGTQLKRLIDRNHYTKEEAEARINSQLAMEEKKAYADLIIDNNGSQKDLKNQLSSALKKIRGHA
ncbi:dephospho-CoA kinase [Streptococcus urinalis]|nr:dephospho-CoA kinase [Streptococcus urinalis]